MGWLSTFSFNGEAWGVSLRAEAAFQIRMRGFWRISGDRVEQFTGTLSRNWQEGQRLYKNGHLVKETSVPPPNLAPCLCVPSARANPRSAPLHPTRPCCPTKGTGASVVPTPGQAAVGENAVGHELHDEQIGGERLRTSKIYARPISANFSDIRGSTWDSMFLSKECNQAPIR